MQTECPHCHTFFNVTDEQLQVADGQVRCGKCNAVFTAEVVAEPENVDESALVIDDISVAELDEFEIEVGDLSIPDSIITPELELSELDNDEPEPLDYSSFESSEQETQQKPESESESESESVDQHSLRLVDSNSPISNDDELTSEAQPYPDLTDAQISSVFIDTSREAANNPSIVDTTTNNSDESRKHAIPVLLDEGNGYDPTQLYPELENAPPPQQAANTGYLITGILLILLLIGQSTYLLRDNLASHGLRPLMESFCAHLNCQLALPRAPDSIVLKRREIRSHPNVTDALSVTATITNQAAFRQAYPLLQIQFQNIEGQLIAGRDFLPSEYLPEDVNVNLGFDSNKSVNIALELIDPSNKAVSFLFIFK